MKNINLVKKIVLILNKVDIRERVHEFSGHILLTTQYKHHHHLLYILWHIKYFLQFLTEWNYSSFFTPFSHNLIFVKTYDKITERCQTRIRSYYFCCFCLTLFILHSVQCSQLILCIKLLDIVYDKSLVYASSLLSATLFIFPSAGIRPEVFLVIILVLETLCSNEL